MLSKTYLAGVFLLASTAAFASSAIGTASARGDIKVDGYAINGNATLFEGSTVETSQTTATLRLQKGTQIKLGSDSQGTMFSDHVLLDHGKGEFTTSDAFQVDASHFQVVATAPNSHGVVAVNDEGGLEVSAISGEFEVRDGTGQMLAKVLAGTAKSFALENGGSGQDNDKKHKKGGGGGTGVGTTGLKGAAIVLVSAGAAIFLVQEGIYHAEGASR